MATYKDTVLRHWYDVHGDAHWVVERDNVVYYQSPENLRMPIDQQLARKELADVCDELSRQMEHRVDRVCEYLGVTPRSTEHLSWQEFIDFGYLQEVNRRFFHPLGLALAMMCDDSEEEAPTGEMFIIDDRYDPVGSWAPPGIFTEEKADRVQGEFDKRHAARVQKLKGVIQPLTTGEQ